ncbi:putative UDP-N-acetylglucosamine--peptide N-acetylglucosaminyltransferase SEC [Cladobotryum mycophilum]|uniref:protein O-GlcNAc transferase n=1 Tax=Cladobotryum mycophilum TaxID=491253 RepID=A0ABR0SUY8_9HYPO
MLPLQMHPRMVPPPPPPSLNPIATPVSRDGSQPEPHHRRAIASPYQQPFPIRMSQTHQRAMLASSGTLSLDHDYQLRRKTPNGTIDAGYDGSPTQLCPGPPPLKQMILPTPPVANSYLSTPNPPPYSLHSGLATERHRSLHDFEDRDYASFTSPWLLTNEAANSEFTLNQGLPISRHSGLPWQPGTHPVQSQFVNFYQPLMRASEYNVRAFCPPPVPMADSPAFGQFGWQPETLSWDPRYSGPFGGFPSNRVPSSLTNRIPQQDSQIQQPYHSTTDPVSVQDVTQSSSLDLRGLCLDSGVGKGCYTLNKQYTTQPTFKEKALLHAHRHYVELLSYLQSVRKVNQINNASGSDASSNPLVYPKPPKPTYGRLNMAQDYPDRTDDAGASHMLPKMDHHTHPLMPNLGGLPAEDRGFRTGQESYARFRNSTVSTTHTPTFLHRAYTVSHSHEPMNGTASGGRPLPAVNAKNSLEVLRNLCEQSNWGWIDGIILGGCLQYGLERYDDALKWFSRVVALDSSHVEAITNMAATLYCLGRQDEAEQHWLMAIRLCPSYLDAAEHLVGLMYRKRSQEAINVICFIQRALNPAARSTLQATYRTPSSKDTPSITNDVSTAEFGSSGYALAGSENGRMLALVHAKGTMLYNLKDIRRASEAFEEAVSDGPISTPLRPLLLPPEKARQTAHLVFSGSGELPGLSPVPEGSAKRAAIQTTSNALLSLAKIFQDAMSSGTADASLVRRPSGVGDILALYYLSLSLQESPSTANNVGILLAGVQQAISSTLGVSTTLPSQPTLPGIVPGSGLALALAYYNYGLRLDPKHVHLHTNLGSLLKDVGQLDLAIQMYERAVSCDGTFDIALTNLANAVKDKGRIKDAIAYYRRAVESNPAFAEAVCGLLTALNSVCDWRGRGGVLLDSGRYDRWHVNEDGALQDVRTTMRGGGLTKRVVGIVRQQLGEASHWGCNILQQSTIRVFLSQLQRFCSTETFNLEKALEEWAGKIWEGSRLVRLLERAARVIQWTWYRDRYIHDRAVAPVHYPRPRLPPSLAVPSAPTVLPFHTFTCPLSAKDIRAISQRNAIRISCSTLRSSWLPSTVYPPPPPPHPHLNIGYVSSDFNNHPLAHLMQSVFGFHNPQRARAFCYATTPSDRSLHRQQIEREAPVFRDVSAWSPDKLIEQIVADQIHILVNLNGYTRGARNEIFAARPAPIQMSFMGFAGTLGAEWCDYIMADTTAIPPSTLRPWRNNMTIGDVFHDNNEGDEPDWMYSENIIFCRDTFFCCDHAQSCGEDEREMTWEEEQSRRWKMRKELFPSLPDDIIILANFNQLYKIEPTTFRSWLRILARTPKAILWLLRFPDLGESNLRHTAELWAGAEVASRLIFTDVAPKSQHISRARVCDLFLDTPECNAHTTAADVLWSSTPLLTLPRYPYKMCSRMAASILKGALPRSPEGQQAALELIVDNEAEYEESAAELASGLTYSTTGAGYGEGRGRLADMRKLLWESKWKCALFNTRRWVNDVEEAYDEAWRRWVAGEGGDIYL